jgi:hypothetical protein
MSVYRLASNRFTFITALILSIAIHMLFLYALGNLGFEQRSAKSSSTAQLTLEVRLVALHSSKYSLDQSISADQTEKGRRGAINQATHVGRNSITANNTELIQAKGALDKAAKQFISQPSDINNEPGTTSKTNTPADNEKAINEPPLDLALRKSTLAKSSVSELASQRLQMEHKKTSSEFSSKIESAKKETCLKNQGAGLLGLPVLAYQIFNDKCSFN